MSRPRVAVVFGSDSDWPVMEKCVKQLRAFGEDPFVEVMSAHRNPDRVSEFANGAEKDGIEVIIGAKAVPGLGHIVMFGLGGIYVEVLKDAGFKLTPVTQHEAREMIESIKAYSVLSGVRGQTGTDLDALVEMIQRVSQMLTENPEIRELDINPAFASARGIKAADVRVFV